MKLKAEALRLPPPLLGVGERSAGMRIVKGFLLTFTEGLSAKKKEGRPVWFTGSSGPSISCDSLSASDVRRTLALGNGAVAKRAAPLMSGSFGSCERLSAPDSWKSCASAGAGGHTCARADNRAKRAPFVGTRRIVADKTGKSVGFRVFSRCCA